MLHVAKSGNENKIQTMEVDNATNLLLQQPSKLSLFVLVEIYTLFLSLFFSHIDLCFSFPSKKEENLKFRREKNRSEQAQSERAKWTPSVIVC